jgi:hypothetical protein
MTPAFYAWLVMIMFSGCGQQTDESIPAYRFETYALFSWNAKPGDFCFAIMTQAEGDRFIHRWFPKRGAKCGISDLEAALVALPKGSYVLWEDWPPKGFDYPPDNVVAEVITFAQKNDIHLERSPALR